MAIRCFFFATLLLALASTPLSAQTTLREGDRVRVTLAGASRATGVVTSLGSDSLVIVADPDAQRFASALRDHTLLEVSRGRSVATGAAKGALWGGAAWGGFNVALLIPESHKSVRLRAEIAILQTAVGAGIGAIIGALVRTERWEPVVAPSASLPL